MANSKIFASASLAASRHNNVATAKNLAGGKAYAFTDKAALAQMAVTSVVNDTYYASAKHQLTEIRELASSVEPYFLAQLALYARGNASMKDLPAYLCAVLAERDVSLLAKIFDRVIDNGKMLRNFVQMVRSGTAGRRSLGTRPKKLVQAWLQNASFEKLLAASVGNSPSLADVIRLSHPKADTPERDAMFKYLLGREVEVSVLPQCVQDLEAFRAGTSVTVPKVPFELLTALPLSCKDWEVIARNASWTQTRLNLNTFLRQGVFESREMVDLVAKRLQDPVLVAKSKVFPYQLFAAYKSVNVDMPSSVVNALQDAMEHAIANVPQFDGDAALLVDTSGSMRNPITGTRAGATSKIACVDVAALFASAVLRQNPNSTVVPFDTKVHQARLNPRDSVMTNTQALARFGGGGTNCGIALEHLNAINSCAQVVIYISDNESWIESQYSARTGVMDQWHIYKKRVPTAKLVCVDLTPNKTTQARDRFDVLNVGGFSDDVFKVINLFNRGELSSAYWVGEIEKTVV